MFHLTIVGTDKGFDVDTRKTIGRLPVPEVSVQLLDVTVSKRHCTVEAVHGKYILVRDLGSLNGTFVNGKRVKGEAQAFPGSEIQIGGFRLQVKDHYSDAAFDELTPLRTEVRHSTQVYDDEVSAVSLKT
jgi:pSer/pThr/pTyr-binding forkhead associated (FHA) protein